MGRFWEAIEKQAGRLANWAGALTAMTGVFGWLASKTVFLQPYGWPEFIFVGLIFSLIIIVVLSFGVIAYRKLRPLPEEASSSSLSVTPFPDDTRIEDVRKVLANLDSKLESWTAEFSERIQAENAAIAEISKKISVDFPNATTVAEAFKNLDDATRTKIARIGEESKGFQKKVEVTFLDVSHLLYFNVLQATDALLSHLHAIAPKRGVAADSSSEWNVDAFEVNQKFLDEVSNGLSSTNRWSAFINIQHNAEFEADRHLGTLSPEQWPSNVNPVDVRRYFIAALRRREVTAYLERQIEEVRQNIRYARSKLLERMEERERLK